MTTNNDSRPEENMMLLRLYGILVLLFDLLVMQLKCISAFAEAFYIKIFPVTEKSVVGEIVLITGAGHGIGKELALKYASLGATVVCVDVNEETNKQTVTLANEMGYKKVHAYQCDVSKQEEITELIEKVTKEVGPVTILINNAGIMPCHPFLKHTTEEITKIFDINVFAHFWLIKAILPRMIKNNHGHIVALSSMAGIMGITNLVPYCASKFAVRGMMEALAEEIRENGNADDVHFTCIYPYMVDTGLCKKPRIRFPSLMNMVNPKMAAEKIIQAQRRNETNVSIPTYYLYLNNFFRCFPEKLVNELKDFIGSGVDSDEYL